MENSTFEGVREAVASALEIQKGSVCIDSMVSDFPNWDSLGYIRVIMNLFERFGEELDIMKLVECKSIRGICEYIESTMIR